MLKISHNRVIIAILIYASLGLAGCGSLRMASITVEFQDSVQGLARGDQVYFLGLPIGETGSPFIINNRAIVPVVLDDASTLDQTGQIFFLLTPDGARPGRKCLVAYIHKLPPEPGQPKFRGFTSRVNLEAQIGSESIGSWLKQLQNYR